MFFFDETNTRSFRGNSLYLAFGDLSTTVRGSPASLTTMGASDITGDTPGRVFTHQASLTRRAELAYSTTESSKIDETQQNFIDFH